MSVPQARFDPAMLRVMLVSDGRADLVRLEAVVQAAIDGGIRCVQLREPHWSARMLLQAAERLRPKLDAVRGLLLVNDRLDVVAAGVCHGAQIGHRSLPPALARKVIGPGPILGGSTHNAEELAAAAVGGCDFALLSPVWPSSSKPGQANLGEVQAAALTANARLPVVWLGGIEPPQAARAADQVPPGRPIGIAVRSAVMGAADPRYAATALVRAMTPLPLGRTTG